MPEFNDIFRSVVCSSLTHCVTQGGVDAVAARLQIRAGEKAIRLRVMPGQSVADRVDELVEYIHGLDLPRWEQAERHGLLWSLLFECCLLQNSFPQAFQFDLQSALREASGNVKLLAPVWWGKHTPRTKKKLEKLISPFVSITCHITTAYFVDSIVPVIAELYSTASQRIPLLVAIGIPKKFHPQGAGNAMEFWTAVAQEIDQGRCSRDAFEILVRRVCDDWPENEKVPDFCHTLGIFPKDRNDSHLIDLS